ncbi:MAG: SPOR domain-containing protein [Nitrospirae bacterium]|nr:SPOR domain-containing protein [Nitrospirota bacterium]
MREVDLTLIRKRLAKKLGQSAGHSARPVKGPYDVPIKSHSKGYYLKLVGSAAFLILAIGFAAYMMEPEPATEPKTETSRAPSPEEAAAEKASVLRKLASGSPRAAVSAPITEEVPSGDSVPKATSTHRPSAGFYVQVAAYRSLKFVDPGRALMEKAGYRGEIVVQETEWIPRYVEIQPGADPSGLKERVERALAGLGRPVLVESPGSHSARVGPIYQAAAAEAASSRLHRAGLPARIVTSEPEKIYILLLGPLEDEPHARQVQQQIRPFAADAEIVRHEG